MRPNRFPYSGLTILTVGLALTALSFGCSADDAKSDASETNTAEAAPAAIPSLQAELDARKAQFMEKASPEVIATYEDGVDAVRELGVLEAAVTVGDTAPEFTLPNAFGEQVTLSSLLAEGPVVITWYRGGWCPYCNIQLKAMQDILPEIRAEGATLVAISPETPDNSLSTVEKDSLDFVVLSDAGNGVARAYGVSYPLPEAVRASFEANGLLLPEHNGTDSWDLPLGAAYIIGTDRVVRYAYLDADYRKRAEPAEILAALQGMTQ